MIKEFNSKRKPRIRKKLHVDEYQVNYIKLSFLNISENEYDEFFDAACDILDEYVEQQRKSLSYRNRKLIRLQDCNTIGFYDGNEKHGSVFMNAPVKVLNAENYDTIRECFENRFGYCLESVSTIDDAHYPVN